MFDAHAMVHIKLKTNITKVKFVIIRIDSITVHNFCKYYSKSNDFSLVERYQRVEHFKRKKYYQNEKKRVQNIFRFTRLCSMFIGWQPNNNSKVKP